MRLLIIPMTVLLLACQPGRNQAQDAAISSEFTSLESQVFGLRRVSIVLDSTSLDSVQRALGGRVVVRGHDSEFGHSLCYRIGNDSSGMVVVLESNVVATYDNSITNLTIGAVPSVPSVPADCADIGLNEGDVRLPFGLTPRMTRAELVQRLGSAHRVNSDSTVTYQFQRETSGTNDSGHIVKFYSFSELEATFRSHSRPTLVFSQTTTS